MKPSKLKRHLLTRHPECAMKGRDFFLRKKDLFSRQTSIMKNIVTVPDKALRASFAASLRIAKAKKPQNIGEELLLPACVEMVQEMLGKEAASKNAQIPLSDNTVNRRIEELSSDIRHQTGEKVRNSPMFALQLDESTDVSKSAQLLGFVRFVDSGNILEDFLFCEELKERTTGADSFECLDN